jgi:hypothetical protein
MVAPGTVHVHVRLAEEAVVYDCVDPTQTGVLPEILGVGKALTVTVAVPVIVCVHDEPLVPTTV